MNRKSAGLCVSPQTCSESWVPSSRCAIRDVPAKRISNVIADCPRLGAGAARIHGCERFVVVANQICRAERSDDVRLVRRHPDRAFDRRVPLVLDLTIWPKRAACNILPGPARRLVPSSRTARPRRLLVERAPSPACHPCRHPDGGPLRVEVRRGCGLGVVLELTLHTRDRETCKMKAGASGDVLFTGVSASEWIVSVDTLSASCGFDGVRCSPRTLYDSQILL